MAIVGITVSETGEPIQRLAISHKVAIGLPPETGDNGRKYPIKLDHFVFQRKVKGKAGVIAWEVDPEMTKFYGENCRDFWIVLHSDNLDDIFKTEYAWWTKAAKKCWGDGREATRRTEKNPRGEPWKPCGKACPDLERGDCKASGDLYFIPMDFPRLGSVWKLHTGGRRSIQQIYASLSQFQSTFGRLAGLKVKLAVRQEKTTYISDGKPKPTTIPALSLELAAEDWKKLTDGAVEPALMFERARKLLGTGTKVEYQAEEEDEAAQAPALAAEFYPENEAPEAPAIQEPKRASETKASEPPKAQPAETAEGQEQELAAPGKGSRVIVIEEVEIVLKPEKGGRPFAAIKAKGAAVPFLCFDESQFKNLASLKGQEICIDYADGKAGSKLFHEILDFWKAPKSSDQ